MLSFKRVVCAVAVCAMVVTAFGAARKIKAFEAFDPEPLAADGMAIINHARGANKTVAQVILSDFTPGQEYVVIVGAAGQMFVDRSTAGGPYIRVDPADAMIAGEDGSLVASGKGHLTVHLSTADGEGNEFFDSVGVVTVADWDARTPALFGTRDVIKASVAGGSIAQP